jgi:hypothetical protein
LKNIELEDGANHNTLLPQVTFINPPIRGTADPGTTIHIYQSDLTDPQGSLVLLETLAVNAAGEFTSALGASALGSAVVLTATDSQGETSEFLSICYDPECEPDEPAPEPDPVGVLLFGFFNCGEQDPVEMKSARLDAGVVLLWLPAVLYGCSRRRRDRK